jgi:hypothetical protein
MDAAPPKLSTASPGLRLATVLLVILAAMAMVVVFFFNPSTAGFYPVCQFHRLTGLQCPGCGATRATYAVLHGDLRTALHDNVLLVASLVAVPLRGVWYWRKKGQSPAVRFLPDRWLWVLAGIAVVFTIVRNLPAFSYLAPI